MPTARRNDAHLERFPCLYQYFRTELCWRESPAWKPISLPKVQERWSWAYKFDSTALRRRAPTRGPRLSRWCMNGHLATYFHL